MYRSIFPRSLRLTAPRTSPSLNLFHSPRSASSIPSYLWFRDRNPSCKYFLIFQKFSLTQLSFFRPPPGGYAQVDFPSKSCGDFPINSTLVISFDLEVRPYNNFTNYFSGVVKRDRKLPHCELEILVGCASLFNQTIWNSHGEFRFKKTDLFLAHDCMPITFIETCHREPAQLMLKNLYIGPPDEDDNLQEYMSTATGKATSMPTATLTEHPRHTVSINGNCTRCDA